MTTEVLQPNSSSRSVVIVGGRGMMGSFFVCRFVHFGHKVAILDRDDWCDAAKILASADLVLICVPIDVTRRVIVQLGMLLNPDVCLVDITSIKRPFLDAMLEHHKGPVLGLHPMFGPKVKSFRSQKVVVCEGRHAGHFDWLLRLIEDDGGELITCSADEHDRMMGVVQATRHFATIGLGNFLFREGVDISRSLDFASPIYRMEMDMVGRLFAQAPALYVDIILATEERRMAIHRFAASITELADLVRSNDREGMIRQFQDIARFFDSETHRALEESAVLVDALCTHLLKKTMHSKSTARKQA